MIKSLGMDVALLHDQNRSSIELNRWLKQKALRLEKKKHYSAASDVWKNLLTRSLRLGATDRECAWLHFHIGRTEDLLQNRNRARFHLKAAVRLDSSEPEFVEHLAQCYLREGHWRLAKSGFEKALRLRGDKPSLWAKYAWLLMKLDEPEKALEVSNRVLLAFSFEQIGEVSLARIIQVYTESRAWDQLVSLLHRLKAEEVSLSPGLQMMIKTGRRQYQLSFQGAVHQLIRRGGLLDQPFWNLKHLRRAEARWTEFCRREKGFASRRADLRLARVWAAASLLQAFLDEEEKEDDDTERQVADKFRVSRYEIVAAKKLIAESQS